MMHRRDYIQTEALGQFMPGVRRQEEYKCITCKSRFLVVGTPDVKALEHQQIVCPVCGQVLPIASPRIRWWGGVTTFDWKVGPILERGPEPIRVPTYMPPEPEKVIFWEAIKEEEIERYKKIALYVFGAVAALIVLKVVVDKILK